MAIFTRQSTSWFPLKGMQLHNGSTFVNPKQGWVYTGTQWRIFYPENPQNTGLPIISGLAAYGYTLSTTNGTWNSNGAYTPTSYSYQWLREGASIPGATGSNYIAAANDIGKNVSVTVTATNGRGSTPITSATVFIVPVMTTITLVDATATPPNPTSVTCTASTTTNYVWSSSWVNTSTNKSGVIVSASNGTVNTYTSESASAASGTGTASPITITVYTYNANYLVTASWSSVIGATSYDVRLDSGTLSNQTGTSITYSTDNLSHTVSVYPKVGTTLGIGSTSNSITPAIKTSSGASSASTTLKTPIIPTITMSANSGVGPAGGTLNWTSTNQSTYAITGGLSATGGTATTKAFTGLVASTTYTGRVTVTSSDSNTAFASYSLTTSAPPPGTISVSGISGSKSGTSLIGSWSRTLTNCSFSWYNTRIRNTNTNNTAAHTLFSNVTTDTFTNVISSTYKFGIQGVASENGTGTQIYSIGTSDANNGVGSYAESGNVTI